MVHDKPANYGVGRVEHALWKGYPRIHASLVMNEAAEIKT
jgi:hypothetical protein